MYCKHRPGGEPLHSRRMSSLCTLWHCKHVDMSDTTLVSELDCYKEPDVNLNQITRSDSAHSVASLLGLREPAAQVLLQLCTTRCDHRIAVPVATLTFCSSAFRWILCPLRTASPQLSQNPEGWHEGLVSARKPS